MTWQAFICDTMTGAVKNPVKLSSCTYGRMLNATAGTKQATMPLLDKTNRSLDLDDLLDPIRNSLRLDWDGTPVYGAVIGDATDNLDDTSVSFPHMDLWWFLGKRLGVDRTAAHVETTSETYTSLDLGTIAKRRVQLATTGDASRNLALPITYPGDASGGITRTFYGYDLQILADQLTDIVNEGPDIDFQPQKVGGALNYLMRVGRTATPDLTGGPWEWRASGTKPNIFGVTRLVSGQKLTNNAVVIGEGSEVDMLVRSEPDLTSPYPLMDNIDAHKDVHDVAQASALAAANLNAFKRPTVQWAGSIMANGMPDKYGVLTAATVADLIPGGTAKIWVQDHPRIPDGWATTRVIGYSGDISSLKVDLQLQPGRY